MQMTPMDMRGKTFVRRIRGYEPAEVDRFLQEAAEGFEAVYRENFELKETVERLETELANYKTLEELLRQSLVLAQKTAAEVKEAAGREAELIIREAEAESKRRLSQMEEKWTEIQAEIQGLLRRRELVRTQLKSFLEAQLAFALSSEEDKVSS
ncbi:DivIVA family [Acididesulfobacillus acetoxydans]|uniref:DivIVA family n=1 Tax=Acididesulfobacillus acetoxydans TaxID=1561005 RepID=A0A8S0X6X7_9FIRM|nr:DivIVA domain-containing protein [Acididesulfobacillus acetoxydans]CAA7602870.1 DivIVA family [Acididesulfobacillus acetoxydans]CEJ05751.1 DivIVA protein [Acididesulfobacillus acetoxydans]